MSEQKPNHPIEDTVMNLIRSKHIRMKPRWYFILSLGSAVVAGASALIIGILSLNLFLFAFVAQGRMASFRFDMLLSKYPWWSFLLAGGAVYVARFLYKKTQSAYKYNTITILGVIVSSVLLGALLLHLLGFDQYMARSNHFRGIYHRYEPRMDGTGPHGNGMWRK